MDLFGAFAEPKSEVKPEYLPDELEDAFQATQIVTTPMQPNLEEEQITVHRAYQLGNVCIATETKFRCSSQIHKGQGRRR